MLGVSRNSIHLARRGTASVVPHATSRSAAAVSLSTLSLNNNNNSSSSKPAVQLVEVPSLPIVGSKFSKNVPQRRLDNMYGYMAQMRKTFGDFYSVGNPGLGAGLHGTVYVLTDPWEMTKVIRKEGTFPLGMIMKTWPLVQFNKDAQTLLVEGDDGGFFGRGQNWKRMRNFLQTDLLSPVAAKGYVPGMIQATALASQGAPANGADMTEYLARCSFDLFSTVMFGHVANVADLSSDTDPEDLQFCISTMNGLKQLIPCLFSMKELMMVKFLGIKGPFYQDMYDNLLTSREISRKKVMAFRDKRNRGELSEMEAASYCARAMDRQEEEGVNISEEEMVELCMVALTGSVDTTSGVLAWALVHLVLNPEVQETLYQELSHNIQQYGENHQLSEEVLSKAVSPYLSAVIRESHRLTPAASSVIKSIEGSDVEIHGHTLPKGSVINFEMYSVGVDPNIVDNPTSFLPERWFPEAVQNRQGTPSEIIDHAFYKQPFSQGARKCPGARVASYEIHAMIAQLVLDWKMSFADESITRLEQIGQTASGTVQPVMPEFRFEPRV